MNNQDARITNTQDAINYINEAQTPEERTTRKRRVYALIYKVGPTRLKEILKGNQPKERSI